MRHFLPLLIGVIVTPLTAAAHHEVLLAQGGNESGTAEVVEVFQGEHVLILTEGVFGGERQANTLTKVPIRMKSLESCKAEGEKWAAGETRFRKGFKQYDCIPIR